MTDTRCDSDIDRQWMRRALTLAEQGQGAVEPNPMVGCVLVRDGSPIGEGFHQQYGGPHAEVEALRNAAEHGEDPRGSTAYVTLEPCCHHGKTPPCSQALIEAGVARVVLAMLDPFPQVDGGGVAQLREAGIEVQTGMLESAARQLNSPFLRRVRDARPWVIAKWAMSLDGKIATATGHSQWISNESSRREVHRLRGRLDAILVGRGTAAADDPRLTARPPGPRVATRVVCDSSATLSLDSKLCRTARETPVLVACSNSADAARVNALRAAGCEVWLGEEDRDQRIADLLAYLATRGMTNVMVEGGAELLASFWTAKLIDEAHIYVAPTLIGGAGAPSPIAGIGADQLSESLPMQIVETASFENDVRIIARVAADL